jgi:glycosyltransferase involved in cell wall biosynthesis
MVAVSVVIATYNSARYLPEAIESVLAQSFTDRELIVVDDGSTDDTQTVLRRFGSHLVSLSQANLGVSAARNRGLTRCLGQYIAFLDADDTWAPEKLECQIEAMQAYPGHGAYFSAFTRAACDLAPLSVHRSQRSTVSLEDLLLSGNVIGSPCTVIARRALLDLAGGFDLNLSQCADWDMWVRLAGYTDFLYVDRPLATYRQHDANMSRDPALLERDSIRVLEKGFAMAQLEAGVRSRRRRAFARNDVVLAGCYFHAGRHRDAVRCLKRAASLDVRECRRAALFPCRLARRGLASWTLAAQAR